MNSLAIRSSSWKSSLIFRATTEGIPAAKATTQHHVRGAPRRRRRAPRYLQRAVQLAGRDAKRWREPQGDLCSNQDASLAAVQDLSLITLVAADFGGIELDPPHVLHAASPSRPQNVAAASARLVIFARSTSRSPSRALCRPKPHDGDNQNRSSPTTRLQSAARSLIFLTGSTQ